MKPPLPAVLYGTGLFLAFGAGWFFKPATSPYNAAALPHPALPAKRPGPPLPQNADTLATTGGDWLRAVQTEIDAIRAARQPGVANQVLIEKLRAVLQLTERSQRAGSWHGLMAEIQPEDALAVWELLNEGGQPHRSGTEEVDAFLYHWGRIDGPNAVRTLATRILPDEQLRTVLTGWGQQDAASALAWLKADGQNFRSCNRVWGGFFQGLATDPDAAERILLENAAEPLLQPFLGRMAGIKAQQEGLAATVSWFQTMATKPLPDAYKGENLRSLLQLIQQKEGGAGEVSAGFLKGLPAYAHERWLPEEAGMALGIGWATSDPASGIEELDRMTSAEAREAALRVLLNNWEAESLGTWLNANRGHKLFDRAAEALVRGIHASDPEAAKAWAAEIKDPPLRQKSAKLFLPAPADPFASEQ
jgi:hypothetical protein